MDSIIEKRTDLINYFRNENENYTKLDVLNKEFSVLQFSIREEFIDNFVTDYDDIVTNVDDVDGIDVDEIFIKGIIVDVDNKKDYSIIHIQNKENNTSISCDKTVVNRYSDYFENGDVVIVKCHTYNGKFYMHFMIDFMHEQDFEREIAYMNGSLDNIVSKIDYYNIRRPIGLVKQAKYFTSKNGNKCLRLILNVKGETKTFITCSNKYNSIPQKIIAGEFVEYSMSGNSDTFVNNVSRINNLKEIVLKDGLINKGIRK